MKTTSDGPASESTDPSSTAVHQEIDAERMSFLNELSSVSYADLLPNYDGTSWFMKTERSPFMEVFAHNGERKSHKLNVNDVVLLKSGALLGDGRRYFRFNCEGQKVVLTPVYSTPAEGEGKALDSASKFETSVDISSSQEIAKQD